MGNQKEGSLIVKDRISQTEAQQLDEFLVIERSDSFGFIKQDHPSEIKTAKLSLLKTKPRNLSPNKNESHLDSISDSLIGINNKSLDLTRINLRGHRKMKRGVKFGMEVILDLYDCDPKIIRSSRAIKSFANKMCRVLKMKKFGKALTPHFGHDDPKTSGYSLLQFIETSSITGHFSENRNSAYINIFSCRMFSSRKAISFTKNFFKAKDIVARKLTRE
ncbi:MAG: S-adenosylmethionine decarboxylase [Candidatus Omnitrophota bacterium]